MDLSKVNIWIDAILTDDKTKLSEISKGRLELLKNEVNKSNRLEKLGYSEAKTEDGNQAGAVADVEFRPNMEDIDEIVASNAHLHLEYMSDSSIWMSITIPGKEYHVWINPKNPKSNAHIKTWAEQV